MARTRALFGRSARLEGFSRGLRYAIVDVETTGLAPETSSVVEIAIVSLDAARRIVDEWSSLVRPPGTGELGARHIHGISRAMVDDAPTFAQLADEIVGRLRGHVVVGHVVAFDLSHLSSEFSRLGRPLPSLAPASVCTRELARRFLTVRPRTLERCCEAVGVPITRAHRALGDARATAALFSRLAPRLEASTIDQLLAQARELDPKLRWGAPRRGSSSTR